VFKSKTALVSKILSEHELRIESTVIDQATSHYNDSFKKINKIKRNP